jgi:hypothetical protein
MPFVKMPWELLNSMAHHDLSPTATKILPFFLGKNHLDCQHADFYRRAFSISYSELHSKTGFGSSTLSRAIKNLLLCGFIEIDKPGGLRGSGGVTSSYILSPKWRDYKTASKSR